MPIKIILFNGLIDINNFIGYNHFRIEVKFLWEDGIQS